MDKKRLSINLLANLVSYGLSTVVTFYLTPYLVGHLGKELYGFYGIANNFVSYIMVIAMALNSMASKYITVELVRGRELKAKQYFTSIFLSNVLLCLFLTPLLLLVTLRLSSILSVSSSNLNQVQILFVFVFLSMLIRLLTSIYGTATYASNRMDLRAYIEMGKALLRIILYILIFSLFRVSIISVGVVLFVLELFNSIVQIVLSRKLLPQMTIRWEWYDLKLVLSTLKVGVWNSLNQMGDLLLSSSSLLVTNMLLGATASGTISIIITMPALISGIITAVNGVFMPRIAHRYAQGNQESLVQEVHLSQRILGVLITPIILLLMIFAKDFYSLWVPGNDSQLLGNLSNLDIVRMLIIAVSWPLLNITIAMDKVRLPSLILIVMGILNISMMWGMVTFTNLGIYSIVMATLWITILFYGLFIPVYISHIMKCSWYTFYLPFVQLIVAIGILYPLISFVYQWLHITSWFSLLFFGGLLAVLAYLVCAFILMGNGIFNLLKSRIER